MTAAFWIGLFIIFYAFIGYALLLFIIIRIKRLVKGRPSVPDAKNLPACTLIVAAYNEQDTIQEKIKNSFDLAYPKHKLKFIFVTDGSTDKTESIVSTYDQIIHLHSKERMGKMAAVHRAIAHADTDVIVFTDANTFLNREALVNICRHYADDEVGAVAGEKRVNADGSADAASGEGFYWKYESKLKEWDSELYSVVGAAGELFSIKRSLYQPAPQNAILDDFMISMLIAQKGYRIVYEPEAFAMESTSENVKEELKRKIRIAAGGIQSILWLKSLLNPFIRPMLSFQYISHRVLRWTITPFLLLAVFILNAIIVIDKLSPGVYFLLMTAQVIFYTMAILGYLMAGRQIKIKIFFIPYYFTMMNYAVLMGIYRFARGRQSVIWEKAKRK